MFVYICLMNCTIQAVARHMGLMLPRGLDCRLMKSQGNY